MRRRRYSSVLGCLDVAGIDLGLRPSDCPADFIIDVTPSDEVFSAPEVVQHGTHLFTLTAHGIAACDVDLAEGSIAVRAGIGEDPHQIAHFVADVVLPRVAGRHGRCLHAAAVAIDGRAFALIGPSGAGKSTLAARLALQGALLLGDDCALVRDGAVHPAHRPSRLWPDSANRLGVPSSTPDGTGKVSLTESDGVLRCSSPLPLHEVLVVDAEWRSVGVSEALDLLLHETMRLVIPPPTAALDQAVEFLRAFGPRRTIARDATLADLRAL